MSWSSKVLSALRLGPSSVKDRTGQPGHASPVPLVHEANTTISNVFRELCFPFHLATGIKTYRI